MNHTDYLAKMRELQDIENQMLEWARQGRQYLTWAQYQYYERLKRELKDYRAQRKVRG